MWRHLPSLFLVGLALVACGPAPDAGFVQRIPCDGPPPPGQPPPAKPVAVALKAPDYRAAGPLKVTASAGKVPVAGPALAFTRFQPATPKAEVLVVLGHGFMRNRARMAGLAEHVAGWGLEVVTVDLRYSRPWRADHAKNAEDMIAVARHLKAKKVIYAGFSAGGLSALLAAAADPTALGCCGLDPVDDGSGVKAAASLAVPLHGLVGEASSCNANGNGLKLFAAAKNARVLRVDDASHCHFEFPMDALCALVCGSREKRHARAEIQGTILSLCTASLLWQVGIDPQAKAWWTAGSTPYDLLHGAGLLREVK